jgi:phosphoserine phosphatase
VRVDIFDVDYTIVHCSTVEAFILRGLKEGLIGLSIGFYAPYLFVRYGRSGFSGFDAGRTFPFLARVSVAELDKLARRLLDERFLPSLDDAVLRRIELSRRAGRRAVIASSSFSIILRPLAERLGIEDIRRERA